MKETKEQRYKRRKAMATELLRNYLEHFGLRGTVLEREIKWHDPFLDHLALSRKREKTIVHECFMSAYWTDYSYTENALYRG